LIFPLFEKMVRGAPVPGEGALVRLGHSLARAPPRGQNMVFRKMRFGWVQFHIEISKVTLPNFTELLSFNAGGFAVDRVTGRFWISSIVSEIFVAELWSRPKLGQILHVYGP